METHTIDLPFGLPVKEGQERARKIVFGKRPTAADSIRIEDDAQAELAMQKVLMHARAAITQFGDKQRGPYLSEMLNLNRADREVLVDGYMEFLELSRGDRQSEKLDNGRLKLSFGLPHEDKILDIVTLCDKGSELTGYEEQKLERQAGGGFELACITLGYDIARFSDEKGESVVEGPIDIQLIKKLDALDLNDIMSAANERRRLFRRGGVAIQADDSARGNTPST